MMNYRYLVLSLAALALLGAVPSAKADSWVFQRSYYSHDPVSQVRVGRYSYGGPYYTQPQGAYVNSGYRHLRSSIQAGGRSYDHVNVFESWVQVGQQY